MVNLIELQNKIHAQNKELGWWDEERPFSTFVCLFHSELSEAMEGDRKGLMDDHLPEYEMFWVELADFVIRVLDYSGFVGYEDYMDLYDVIIAREKDRLFALGAMHGCVTESRNEELLGNGNDTYMYFLMQGVFVAIKLAEISSVDLHKIILEKVEYNKHRADHKRENRAKDGGKKY